jgi:ATP-binding protein involved in chromosome partitioning
MSADPDGRSKDHKPLPMAGGAPPAQPAPTPEEVRQQLIPGVKTVIPVASGKGGVGKSTVAANLALALQQGGARVGLLDADVYGPSIPLILGIEERPVPGPRGLFPVERHGVKVISMAFFLPPGEALIWRGPMLSKTLDQFLGSVEWGELDYMIVDLPPGTGDIQLSLCQRIPLTGAVIVSTPQDAALAVAERAAFMFEKLNCPVIGIIENMSHFICPHCGQREEIFGSGGCRRAAERLGISYLGDIPLDTRVRSDSDRGHPTVVEAPGSPQAEAFKTVAANLVERVKAQEKARPAETRITF